MSLPHVILIGHYAPEQRERFEARCQVSAIETPQAIETLPESTRSQCRAVAFHGHVPFRGEHMDQLPTLALIANFGVGYDDIDVEAATRRGVSVTNTPDVLNDDVADLAVGMFLTLKRQLIEGDRWVRSGDWSHRGSFPLSQRAHGLRIGILGMGRIGREIADRLNAFKHDIHYFSRSPREVPDQWHYHDSPAALAGAVDALFVCTVGGPETRHLVSEQVLDALPPHAVVVNVSRGSVIDEPALITRLQSGRLAGAALDVFHHEPDVDERLRALANVVLQPHQGSGTVQTRFAMGQLQFDNVEALLTDRPYLTPVNEPRS